MRVSKGNIISELRTDRGFRPIAKYGFSIQGENANKIWHNCLKMAMRVGIPLEIEIEWRDNTKAAFPGRKGFLLWKP